MESEFENYDNLPNGWVYLFQVGDTAGLVCGAKKRQVPRSHLYQSFRRQRESLGTRGARVAFLVYDYVRSQTVSKRAIAEPI